MYFPPLDHSLLILHSQNIHFVQTCKSHLNTRHTSAQLRLFVNPCLSQTAPCTRNTKYNPRHFTYLSLLRKLGSGCPKKRTRHINERPCFFDTYILCKKKAFTSASYLRKLGWIYISPKRQGCAKTNAPLTCKAQRPTTVREPSNCQCVCTVG
jgi:hypothetical protein